MEVFHVILRSKATKNLKILRAAQDDGYSLRGVYPFDELRADSETVEGLTMTLRGFRMDTT